MQIAIASGKGGTGKTSLAVSLFLANADRSRLLDCDVEEPNCHLFLKTRFVSRSSVERRIPLLNPDLCKHCGKCVEACQFNALAEAGKAGILVFEELCHSCGGCSLVCPTGALQETPLKMGAITRALVAEKAELITGALAIGHTETPTLIRAVKKKQPDPEVEFTLIDAPPGTACAFATAVEHADFVLLVAEETPFGLHDLKLTLKALQKKGLPFAVILNRMRPGFSSVQEFCKEKNYPLWLQIPESRDIAGTYARGGTLLDAMPELQESLRLLLDKCAEELLCNRRN
jgi:MinD superfamily P-loop ATPase